jgi:hypothetical protein
MLWTGQVDVGAVFDEKGHKIEPMGLDCFEQGSLALAVLRIGIGAIVEHKLHCLLRGGFVYGPDEGGVAISRYQAHISAICLVSEGSHFGALGPQN